MIKFKTPYNRNEFPAGKGVDCSQKPSLTVPNQALSIQEILLRHARGVPVGVSMQTPLYRGEDYDYPDPAKMDISERVAFAQYLEAELKTMDEAKKTRQAEFRAKKLEEAKQREAAFYKRFKEKMASEGKPSTNNP